MAWTWRADSEVAGLAVLAAADAAGFVSAFCPSLFTVRAFSTKGGYSLTETRGDIYRGLALGGGLAMLAGVGASAVSRSYWPLVATVIALAVILAAFTWALNTPRADAKPMEGQ